MNIARMHSGPSSGVRVTTRKSGGIYKLESGPPCCPLFSPGGHCPTLQSAFGNTVLQSQPHTVGSARFFCFSTMCSLFFLCIFFYYVCGVTLYWGVSEPVSAGFYTNICTLWFVWFCLHGGDAGRVKNAITLFTQQVFVM